MSVLSDAKIRELMKAGTLIPGGDPTKAKRCAYHFTAGKIVLAGVTDKEAFRDWSQQPPAGEPFHVKPRALVWIRTAEHVKIPSDLCAFWWQSNTLARQGLMLVNSAMVEPGYEGPLACLFVNFGKTPIPITPGQTIAKLAFMQLDQASTSPYNWKTSDEDYDIGIHQVAAGAPQTFLEVEDMRQSLDAKKEEAVNYIESKRASEVENIVTNAQAKTQPFLDAAVDSLDAASKLAVDKIKAATTQQLWGLAGGAVIGLGLLVIALNFMPWFQNLVQPNVDAHVGALVQEELDRRLKTETDSMFTVLGDIANRLESLESRD